MRRILAFAIVLAACSPPPAATDESTDANSPADVASPVAPKPASNGPASPQPARIPANFHGLWAEDDAACGQLTHHSRLTVTGNSVRTPPFVLAVESVTQPTPNAFAVKGYSKQTKLPAEAHFSIDATGNILTDEAGGGAVRVRCT